MAAKVKLDMKNYFSGTLNGEKGKLEYGTRKEQFLPYELLYGALGSCMHATFISIADKMRLKYDDAQYDITGKKRDEVPTMLTDVWVTVTISNPSDEKKLIKAMNLAADYCSIYNTLKNIATMHLDIKFEEK